MFNLENKVAIVTGSTRGIGFASAKMLAENGAKVYFAVRRLEDTLKLLEPLKESGLQVDVVFFDASKIESIKGCVEEVFKKEEHVDILVNNYGGTDVSVDFDIENTSFDAFMGIVTDNARSVYETTQAVIPLMKKTGGGSIVNISSVGGVYPDITRSAYATAKKVINFLTEQVALQQAKNNIRCNAVLPGYIETDAAKDNMSPEFLQTFLKTVPLARPGKPEDIAKAVLYYASDMSSFQTGDIIEVAGGFGKATPLYPIYTLGNTK